jgi:hypothetical protein
VKRRVISGKSGLEAVVLTIGKGSGALTMACNAGGHMTRMMPREQLIRAALKRCIQRLRVGA